MQNAEIADYLMLKLFRKLFIHSFPEYFILNRDTHKKFVLGKKLNRHYNSN